MHMVGDRERVTEGLREREVVMVVDLVPVLAIEVDLEREGDLLRVGLTVRQVDMVMVLERERVTDGVRDKDVVRVVERVPERAPEVLLERKRVSVGLKVMVVERDRDGDTVGDPDKTRVRVTDTVGDSRENRRVGLGDNDLVRVPDTLREIKRVLLPVGDVEKVWLPTRGQSKRKHKYNSIGLEARG